MEAVVEDIEVSATFSNDSFGSGSEDAMDMGDSNANAVLRHQKSEDTSRQRHQQQMQHLELSPQQQGPRDLFIVREIYEAPDPQGRFEHQLEQALMEEYQTIVIEPYQLGDETARWIAVGNGMHKTAVVSGLFSLVTASVWPSKTHLFIPATIIAAVCTGVYSLSWQHDHCCNYQVETKPEKLAHLPIDHISTSVPVVLVRRDNNARKFLHSAVTAACVTQTCLRLCFPAISQWLGPK